MDRCGTENAYALAFPFLNLKPLRLNNNAQTFYKENTTEDGE